MVNHLPVMLREVIEALAPERGGLFVDATVGLGGHAAALLEGGASRLIGIDRDGEALRRAAERLEQWRERIELVHSDYRQLAAVLDARSAGEVDGILIDMGLSSFQLESPGRGFSFQRDEPLDMRMDRSTGPTAAEVVAALPEKELADLIFAFGEERYSRRIARAIVAAREQEPVATTGRLAEIVRRAVPRARYSPIHPATRTFQALRIRVNDELDGLDRVLEHACGRLALGGRLAVIAFHSLEDRIVKVTMRRLVSERPDSYALPSRKPLRPTEQEVEANPRARSARLRVIARS
jgi:16S rRNA (cytosine1402-N4)-methyltransferase